MKNNRDDSGRDPLTTSKRKFFFRSTLERFGLGGITSLIVTVVFINIIWLMAGKGTNLREDALVIFDVIGGVMSLFIGGVCGLILGGIWKNNKAPVIGGMLIGAIGPMLLQLVIPLIFGR